jgi:heptosyltransferase-3
MKRRSRITADANIASASAAMPCWSAAVPARMIASGSAPGLAAMRRTSSRIAARGSAAGWATMRDILRYRRPVVPDAINPDSVRNVLVTKLRHHGDVLLASPVFQVLANRMPHAQIDALVYADTRDMLEGHPAVARMHTVDRAWKRAGLAVQARREGALLRALQERRYQLVVHLTEHWRGAWLVQALRPRWSVAPARANTAWGWSFSHQYKLPRGTPRHTVELNLDALRRLGIYPEEAEKPLVMRPGPEAEEKAARLLADAGIAAGGFIHVHPTSRWLFKAWTDERNAELLRRLVRDGHRLVLTAAPDAREKAIVGRILEQAAVPVTDLSGRALVARARGAHRAGAPLLRRRFGADAHRRRHGHPGGGALRPQRRARMGPVARAPPRGHERPSVPALRQRRLRRRQGERVPHPPRGRPRACGGERAARHHAPAHVSATRDRGAPRVALVRGRYDPSGGAERFVQAAIEALRAQGASLTLVTRSWPDHDGNAIVLAPFHVGSLWRDWAFGRAACRTLAERRFDLVQSHERIACCDVYRAAMVCTPNGWKSAPASRAPWRASHAPEPAPPLPARRRARALHQRAPEGRDLQLRDGPPRDRRALRYRRGQAGADPQCRRSEGIPSEAARRDARLRAPAALHPAPRARGAARGQRIREEGRRARCWSAGARPARALGHRGRARQAPRALRGAARALGIAARVRFVGAVSDVRPYYAAADAFALVTLYDPQPNAVLEAMACALPVITTPRCGAAELLEDGVSGYVRGAHDTSGLAEAIGRLEPAHAGPMGQAAHAAVSPYTPQAMAREYLALYERLLAR